MHFVHLAGAFAAVAVVSGLCGYAFRGAIGKEVKAAGKVAAGAASSVASAAGSVASASSQEAKKLGPVA